MINFSDKENVRKLIDLEKLSLTSTLNIQRNLNKQILVFLKNLINNIKITLEINPDDKAFFYLNEANQSLNKSNSNLKNLQILLETLNKIESSNNICKKEIKKYNDIFQELFNSIYESTKDIEKFIYDISTENIAESSELLETFDKDDQAEITSYVNELSPTFIEDTLIISEIQSKVTFPYTVESVLDILINNKNKYDSIQDVIDKFYTKPINYYRFSSIARFKEAYKLVKYKEKGSNLKALSLGLELFSNYNLHPAIITACKSLDELDIYLACLEDNSLNDFHFFKIKYEIPPCISKFAKNNT